MNTRSFVSDPGVVFRALREALVDYVGDHVQNATSNSSHEEGHHADHEPKVLLFLFFAFTVGGEYSTKHKLACSE